MIEKYKNFSLIIVAAGSGSRLSDYSSTPKQYIKINGKTILRHTLDVFLQMQELDNICIVINPEHEDMLKDAINGLDNIQYCFGGSTRKESVYSGIKELSFLNDDDIILVHDAARAFVKINDIRNLTKELNTARAATLACPIVDTLRYYDGKHNKGEQVKRDNLWSIQTPQGFYYGILKQAHKKSNNTKSENEKTHTDDTSLVYDIGENVSFVKSSKENFKITTIEDLKLAKEILSKTQTRSGLGFDVHAFDASNAPAENKAKHIRLCGVDIKHDKTLKGHSDADVGLHALTDAILGTIGEGDIGLHFPPSNNDFKNMDSAIFVKHALKLMESKGGEIVNIDLTLICEAPKIGKHREKITERLSKILLIPAQRINIKATTTEKLGFTGRNEGIAAQCIVNISMPQ